MLSSRVALRATCAALIAAAVLGTPGASGAARVPVVVVVLENHSYGQIVGNASAPYVNCAGPFATTGLICGGKLYTQYTGLFHPSLPAYLAMTSGSNDGCTTDGCPPDSIRQTSVFEQLGRAGFSWFAFQESMTSNCKRHDDPNSLYAVRHNPPPYYRALVASHRCARRDVPLWRLDTKALPAFSLITPNLCDDMHGTSADCYQRYPKCSDIVCVGDTWLSQHVPALIAAGADVVVTFDEPDPGAPATAPIATVQAGPGILAGSTDGRPFTHYSLLRGIQDYFGLTCLQWSCSATPLPIGV
jgi:hypothetical protein